MAVNVMIEVGSEVGGQILGHAVEILEGLEQRGRRLLDRLDAHDCAGRPRGVFGQLDNPLFNDGGNAHGGKDSQ